MRARAQRRAELVRYQYQTNVFGTLDVTMAVLPYMRKREYWA